MTKAITPSIISARHTESQFANDPLIVAVALASGVVSVESPQDIPKSLRWVPSGTPGLLFWHQPLDGFEPVPQLRPDVPDGNKYVFPKGSGSFISINEPMQERLSADTGRTNRILIVEGTKQMIFAATYAPDDVIVVGIPGCWSFSQDGLALGSLNNLCRGRAITVVFDADISSNQNVYLAAESLAATLTAIGATSVTFLKIPGSKKVGLDDFLARQPLDGRAVPIPLMMESAVPLKKIKRPPRQVTKHDGIGPFDFISFDLGEIVVAEFESRDSNGQLERDHIGLAVAGVIDGRPIRRLATLLTAAPRVVTQIQSLDDLSPGVEPTLSYDIELQVGPSSSAKYYTISDVPSSQLHKVRTWLDRAGPAGGAVALGPLGQMSNGQMRIAEVMRSLISQTDVEVRTTLTRTGWYQHSDGRAYWIDSTGAHTEGKKTTAIRGRLEGPAAGIDIPGFVENFTLDDAQNSMKAMLGVLEYLDDPTAWVCGISGIFWAIAGGHPDAVLYLAGGPGSGKSSIAGAFASALSPQWGTGMAPMASVEGTTAYLSDVTKGVHNAPLIIDDARDRSSSLGQASQDDALDKIIRVGYAGGGAARGHKVVDAMGNWRQSGATLNRPFVVVVGETLPYSPPSTIERCLVVEIVAKTSLLPANRTPDGVSGYNHLVDLSQSGDLRPALSHYIFTMMQIANRALRGEGPIAITHIDEQRKLFQAQRTESTNDALAKQWPEGVPASERARNVTGTFVAGASRMCNYIRTLDILTGEQVDALEQQWHGIIINAGVDHTRVNLTHNNDVQIIFEKLQGALESRRYCLGEPNYGETCLGKRLRVHIGDEMVDCVAFIPKVVYEIIGSSGGIERRLASILVRGNGGGLKKQVRLSGDQSWCMVVRSSDFWSSSGVEGSDEVHDQNNFASEDL